MCESKLFSLSLIGLKNAAKYKMRKASCEGMRYLFLKYFFKNLTENSSAIASGTQGLFVVSAPQTTVGTQFYV